MFQTKISPEACWKAPGQSRWGPSSLHYEGFLAAALAASISAQFARRHATSLKCCKAVLHLARKERDELGRPNHRMDWLSTWIFGYKWGYEYYKWRSMICIELYWYVPSNFFFWVKKICQTRRKMFAYKYIWLYIYIIIYIHTCMHAYIHTYINK